jgi:hypothetical protein
MILCIIEAAKIVIITYVQCKYSNNCAHNHSQEVFSSSMKVEGISGMWSWSPLQEITEKVHVSTMFIPICVKHLFINYFS